MKMTLIVDGNTFVSVENDEYEAEDAAEQMYGIMAKADTFKMYLEGGGILILGPDAVKKSVLIFSA